MLSRLFALLICVVSTDRVFTTIMSSPPPMDFATSDLEDSEMQGAAAGQSMSQAPPADPLFLLSPAGTPARPTRNSSALNTPMRGIVARRAVEMSTPKRPHPSTRE